MNNLGSDPDLLNQNLHIAEFLSPVTFEKHCFNLHFSLQENYRMSPGSSQVFRGKGRYLKFSWEILFNPAGDLGPQTCLSFTIGHGRAEHWYRQFKTKWRKKHFYPLHPDLCLIEANIKFRLHCLWKLHPVGITGMVKICWNGKVNSLEGPSSTTAFLRLALHSGLRSSHIRRSSLTNMPMRGVAFVV